MPHDHSNAPAMVETIADNVFDLIVVGMGSVGLTTALSAAQGGLRVGVVDPQSLEQLRGGHFDGRDVAISSASMRWLSSMGIVEGLASDEHSLIRGARVLDSATEKNVALKPAPQEEGIGAFVPEYRLRQETLKILEQQPSVEFFTEEKVASLLHLSDRTELVLESGQHIQGRVVAAVDGRRSPLRRELGIGVTQHDYAMTMVCCRVNHTIDQQGWTSQRFVSGGCMAVLPLSAQLSSLALMMPHAEAERLSTLGDEGFTDWLQHQLGETLGEISLASRRVSVPLSSHYADHMHRRRAVLLGDAAVGMLPITAHGLNLGLIGGRSLVAELLAARGAGEDIGSEAVLKRFSLRAHATARPLYMATDQICRLFQREDPLSLQARRMLLQGSGPFGQLIGMNCEQDDPRQVPWVGVLRDLPRTFLTKWIA